MNQQLLLLLATVTLFAGGVHLFSEKTNLSEANTSITTTHEELISELKITTEKEGQMDILRKYVANGNKVEVSNIINILETINNYGYNRIALKIIEPTLADVHYNDMVKIINHLIYPTPQLSALRTLAPHIKRGKEIVALAFQPQFQNQARQIMDKLSPCQ